MSIANAASYWMVDDSCLPQLTDPLMAPMGDRIRAVRKRGIDTSVEVERHGAIAVVRCDGIAVRRSEYFEAIFDGFSTESLEDTVNKLANDDEVDAIVIWADSPGGQAHGTDAAAKAVQQAATKKPVIGQVQGVAHSAMYYILAGCTRIHLHAEDRLGSIGVIAQLFDQSQRYKAAGVESFTAKTGVLKGIGAPGEPITDEQKAHIQQHVDKLFVDFKSHVASGRGLDPKAVDKLATGGVFNAQQAIELGLADRIATLDETLASLRSGRKKTSPPSTGENAVGADNEPQTNQPASLEDLQLLPGVTDAFCIEAMKQKWTIDQAQSTWMERQAEANTELNKQLEAAQAQAAAATPGVDDSDVDETPPANQSAAAADFEKAVEGFVAKGIDRSDAVLRAAQSNPDSHKAFIASFQEQVA